MSNYFDKVKNDPTVNAIGNAGTQALKLSAAKQGTRAIAKVGKELLTLMLQKTNQAHLVPMLETEVGTMIIEMSTPFLLHGLATHGLIPKFGSQVETVSKLSIDANMAFFAMNYADKFTDMLMQVMTDPATRDNLSKLVNIGTAMSKAESGDTSDLASVLMPDFGEEIIPKFESLREEIRAARVADKD